MADWETQCRNQWNRGFQSFVFNSGQKMALRAFYFINFLCPYVDILLHKAILAPSLVAIENNWLEAPIAIEVLL